MNDIPKSMARVLNAEVVRKTWRENQKKRQSEEGEKGGARKRRRKDGEGGDVGKSKKTETKIGIKPGESLLHFERCVFGCFVLVLSLVLMFCVLLLQAR